MSSLGERRAELVAAIGAGGVDVAPTRARAAGPCVLVYGNGIPDPSTVAIGQVAMSFRMVLVAGSADDEASADLLDALTLVVLGILRGLAGWIVGPVERDTIRRLGPGEYLTRDVSATALVDIS